MNQSTPPRQNCTTPCRLCRAAAAAYHQAPHCRQPQPRKRRDGYDPIAVERAVMGDPPPSLTVAERRAAIRRLAAVGLSYRTIATRLRVHRRTVERHARAA